MNVPFEFYEHQKMEGFHELKPASLMRERRLEWIGFLSHNHSAVEEDQLFNSADKSDLILGDVQNGLSTFSWN